MRLCCTVQGSACNKSWLPHCVHVPEVIWAVHSLQGGLCSTLNAAGVESAISITADLEASTLINQVTPQRLSLCSPLLSCHALHCAFIPADKVASKHSR